MRRGEEPALWRLVRSGDASELLAQINAGASITVPEGPFGWTPLHVAAGHGSLAVAQTLLNAQANVNARASDGETPLHIATQEACEHAVQILIANRADVNAQNDDGETPLHTAVQRGDSGGGFGHIKALLNARGDTSMRDNDGHSVIQQLRLFAGAKADELEALLQENAGRAQPDEDDIDQDEAKVNGQSVPDELLEPPSKSTGRMTDVGEVVRIMSQGVARRATVACRHDDNVFEVIYEDDGSEAVVPMCNMRPLEPFERQSPTCEGTNLQEEVARCREEGNTLFRLGDTMAAAERYSAAINALGLVELECSHHVLAVVDKTMWLGCGQWSADSQDGLLQFLRCVGERAPISHRKVQPRRVLRKRVLAVRGDPLADAQIALYLNRARCWLAVGDNARALQDCELAGALRRAGRPPKPPLQWPKFAWPTLIAALGLALAKVNWAAGVALLLTIGIILLGSLAATRAAAAEDRGDARLCTVRFLRARARLAQGRIQQAQKEFRQAARLAPGSNQLAELHKLRQDILEARKDNRRLAKEVSKWCEAAMAKAKPDAFAASSQD